MPGHEHASLGLSIVLRGQVEEQVGRTTVQAGTGQLVVKPAGTVHANRFGPAGARLLSIDIHPTVAEDSVRTLKALARWRWLRSIAALRIAARTLALARWPEETGGALAATVVLELSELLAEGIVRPADRRPSAWLLAVRDRLHAEHASSCRVRELASLAGVHPVHLARRFRAQFGCSVTEYLRNLRLHAAAAALADEAQPVGAVAAATGFADQSHLCRVFRSAVGVSPSGYRSLARAG